MKKIFVIILSLISSSLICQTFDVIGGYFPYWRSTESANFENYNYNYFAFVFPTNTGGIAKVTNRENAFNSFISATDGVKTKRLISVGSTGMSEMAMTQENRQNFADTLRKFCRHFGLQGIDMDWESIDNATDSANFSALMQEIRTTVDTTDLEFVITVGSGDYWLKWYSNSAMHQADFLQIMVYDKTGTWAASPFGNHSSIDHFKQAETYWLNRGFTRDQLVMGLPYYGYKFKDEKGGLAEAATYAEIMKRFPNAQPTDNLLSDESGYYWFNGYALIREKVKYAAEKGFKGVFVWEIAQDDLDHTLSLEKAIYDEINGADTPIIETSVTSAIDLNNSSSEITTYPSPASNTVFIKGTDLNISYSIYKFDGNQVLSGTYSENGIDVTNLEAGFYIIQVGNNTSKFIIE